MAAHLIFAVHLVLAWKTRRTIVAAFKCTMKTAWRIGSLR
jgi:hypothetical protein